MDEVLLFFQSGGTTTISIDGNFGLVRKYHAGKSPRTISTTNGFFVDNAVVDAFVDQYSDDKQQDKVSDQFNLLKI